MNANFAVMGKLFRSAFEVLILGILLANNFLTALMYWQWSLAGGPRTVIEKMVFWTHVSVSIMGGYRYLFIGSYQPLICLWYANFFGLLGWILG